MSMRNLRRSFAILAMVLICSAVAVSKEQMLLTASNDQDSGKDQLVLRLDSKNRPTQLIHRQTGKAEKAYTPSQLSKGVVLRRQSGKNLLVLKAIGFDPAYGAKIELRYLYTAVPSAEFRTLRLKLVKSRGRWIVQEGKGAKPVKSIRFLANVATVFGFQKAIGIRSILLKR